MFPSTQNRYSERNDRERGRDVFFFIIGFGKRTKSLLGPGGTHYCRSCGRTVQWQVYKVTKWVTLFFIPVIPYRTEYYLACTDCGEWMPISRRDAADYLSGVGGRTTPAPG